MSKLSLKLRNNCVWWLCTLVALIPAVIIIWVIYVMFF